MKKKFMHHMGLRAVAMLLAVVLWVHTSGEQTHELMTDIPIKYKGLPEELTFVGYVPNTITVKIHAAGFELLQLRAIDFFGLYVELDVSNVQKGRETFNLNIYDIVLPNDIQIQNIEIIENERLTLNFDQTIEKELPITPMVTVIPLIGYVSVGKPEVDPPITTVRGPEKIVSNMKTIKTEAKRITNVDQPITIQVGYDIPEYSHLVCKPGRAIITQNVEKFVRRTDNIPIEITHLRQGYTAQIDPPTATITISGIASQMDSISVEDIQCTINARRLKPQIPHVVPVKLDYPELPNINVELLTPDSCTLFIKKVEQS